MTQCVAGGQPQLVSLLLKYGADVNSVTLGGTALLAAIDLNYLQCLKLLLDSGANPDIPDRGQAMLRAEGKPQVIDILRSHGATDLAAEVEETLDKIRNAVIDGKREKVMELLDGEWPAGRSLSLRD